MPNPLPVVWLPQKPGLCGAATAQMILHARGIVGAGLNDLDSLWVQIKANTSLEPPGDAKQTGLSPCGHFKLQICESCKSSRRRFCWCTVPSALAATLNDNLGANAVSVHKEAREEDVTARAIQSVDSGVAAGTLVHHGTHWLVVYGYRPLNPGPTEPITHLLVQDSEFFTTSTLVTVSHWLAAKLTEIRCGRFKPFSLAVTSGADRDRRVIPPAVKLSGLPPVVEPARISALAKADAEWLLTTQRWTSSVGRATMREPAFVRDLSESNMDYYLVDFRTEGRPTARMIYDARQRFGPQFAGIDAYGDGPPGNELPPLIAAADAERQVREQAAARPASGGYTVEPTLAWRPCDQSHSPYQPFYVVHQDGATRYVRVDGAVFSQLTDSGGGA